MCVSTSQWHKTVVFLLSHNCDRKRMFWPTALTTQTTRISYGSSCFEFLQHLCSLSRGQGAIENNPGKRSRSTLAIQICRPSTAIYPKSFGRGAAWISRLQRRPAATSKRLFNSTHDFLQSSTRFSTRLQNLLEVNV